MDIQKIAIIGGGPSGLVSLNEFLHTNKNGESTIRSLRTCDNIPSTDPAFKEIVVFEQNNDIGGVWLYNKESDPDLPNTESYSEPEHVRKHLNSPSETELKHTSKDAPLTRKITFEDDANIELWNKSAVYDHLFTNVPNRLMRFTSGFDLEVPGTGKENNIYYPFVTHEKVLKYLQHYVEANNLRKHIRFNTTVEKVYKKDNKWILTVVHIDYLSGCEHWYNETFDAVLCAVGRFNVPFIPDIENLNNFRLKYPGVISHTKSYRNSKEYEGKKVLLVGSSVSAIDLLQYLVPKCKEVWLSTNPSNSTPQSKETNWLKIILNDENINVKRCSKIRKFVDNGVEFEDGKIIENFDKILFATGYHLTYPFLNIPENKGKDYIKIGSGKNDEPNYAKTKVENVFMYTFTVNEPTLAHIGILQNPLFFFAAEASSIAMAGVWSNNKKLPSLEKQKEWCTNRICGKNSGFQVYDEKTIIPFIKMIYKYAPEHRLDMLQILEPNEVVESRKVLIDLFYKISSGEYDDIDYN